METKTCPNCGKTMFKELKYRKGYQGQDWAESAWEGHSTEDCIKYLRSLIDDRRIV